MFELFYRYFESNEIIIFINLGEETYYELENSKKYK